MSESAYTFCRERERERERERLLLPYSLLYVLNVSVFMCVCPVHCYSCCTIDVFMCVQSKAVCVRCREDGGIWES